MGPALGWEEPSRAEPGSIRVLGLCFPWDPGVRAWDAVEDVSTASASCCPGVTAVPEPHGDAQPLLAPSSLLLCRARCAPALQGPQAPVLRAQVSLPTSLPTLASAQGAPRVVG